MRELGNGMVEQDPVGRMIQRLVEGVRADADGTPAQVILPHVDGIHRRAPRFQALGKDLGLGYLVVVQGIVGHVILGAAHVLDAVIVIAFIIGNEKHVTALVLPRFGIGQDVAISIGDLAKSRREIGGLAIPDVVLLAFRDVGAIFLRDQFHLGGIQVRPVLLFREAECKHAAFLQALRGFLLYFLVLAHPNRPEPENADLPGVPVIREAIKAKDLVEIAIPIRIPSRGQALIFMACIPRGRQEVREYLLALLEINEILVPDIRMLVFLYPFFALGLEKRDGLLHHLPRRGIQFRKIRVVRIQ